MDFQMLAKKLKNLFTVWSSEAEAKSLPSSENEHA